MPMAEASLDGSIGPDGVFHYPPGAFYIAFPGMPLHTTQRTPSEQGELVTELFVHETGDTLAYMVAYSDHPYELIQGAGAGTVLERAVRGALDALGIADVESSEPVRLNNDQGVRFRAKGNGYHMISHVQFIGTRLFRTTLLSQGRYAPREVADRFFKSFHYAAPPVLDQEDDGLDVVRALVPDSMRIE